MNTRRLRSFTTHCTCLSKTKQDRQACENFTKITSDGLSYWVCKLEWDSSMNIKIKK